MDGKYPIYPVGKPGTPWGDAEKEQWRARQAKQRDYFTEVVSKLMRCTAGEIFSYGMIDYRRFGSANFPMFGIRSANWKPEQPMAVITGGVHGYETSGVQGSIMFVDKHMASYVDKGINVLVLPCLSPWGYEMIQRWTPNAVDPNRCFNPSKPGCIEAELAMKCIHEHLSRSSGIVAHVDSHETTNTDNTEFTPAKIARDAKDEAWDEIPPGYYSVANTHAPENEYHKFVIERVAKVTPIAPADKNGCIIGEKETERGCVHVPGKEEQLCGAMTAHWPNKNVLNDDPLSAAFPFALSLTTEIYPDMVDKDGKKCVSDDECNRAQAETHTATLDYALARLNKK